jgi:hypothetical protein
MYSESKAWPDATKSVSSLIELTLLDPVTRRLWKERKTNSQDHRPEELHSNRDTVRAGVATFLSSEHDAVGEQDTNGDTELVSGNNSTTNFARSNLRHVPMVVSDCLKQR